VVQSRVIGDIVQRTCSSTLGVGGSENEMLYPGLDNGPHTHQAGFDGSRQDAARQAVISLNRSSTSQREDLRVGSRVVERDWLIGGARDDLSIHACKYGADRYFSAVESRAGLTQGLLHQVGKIRSHKKKYLCIFLFRQSTAYFLPDYRQSVIFPPKRDVAEFKPPCLRALLPHTTRDLRLASDALPVIRIPSGLSAFTHVDEN